MNGGELAYLDLLSHLLEKGVDRPDRTSVGTRSIFGAQLRFDLKEGFPLLTTRKLFLHTALSELLWFIEGSSDERRLAEIRYGKPREQLAEKTTIWTGNAQAPYWIDKSPYPGSIGRAYPVQLRHWTNRHGVEIDQLTRLVDGLINDPSSRRHIITWFNPGELDETALPACHTQAMFDVTDGRLNCMFTMRSSDAWNGLPTNVSFYSLFTHMLAQCTGYEVGEVVYCGSNVHLYLNALDAAKELVTRTPGPLPTLIMNATITDITKFTMGDFALSNYTPQPSITVPMVV